MTKGLGYIRLKGLTFEHAGNGFIRSGNGAVATWGGHHWIIEDNAVRHVNAVAIEIGALTDEGSDSGDPRELEKTIGDHMVRGNHVYDCGTGGIQGTIVARSLVAGNHIHDCHGAPGIWIDCGNRNSRVTRNLLHDIAAANGAIFFEASNVVNLIDHNVLARTGDGFDLSDWQKSGLDTHSTAAELDLVIDADNQQLAWSSPTAAATVPRDELLSLDYFGRPYPGDKIPVGPFTEG